MPATLQAPPFIIQRLSDIPKHLPYHTHFTFEIYYFHAGKVNYLINDRIYRLQPGDLVLMHGMTLHKAHLEQQDCYERTVIHFDPLYFEAYIEPSYAPNLLAPFRSLKNIVLTLEASVREDIEQILHRLVMLQKNRDQPQLNFQRTHALLLDLMLLIHNQCQTTLQITPSSREFSTKEQHVQELISYIEEHYKEDLTLDLIQSNVHLNKFYMSKLFKEITGTTIFQYIVERRLYAAKLLLISSDIKITEISYEVGFKHSAHFSRAFKQATGLTAEQYRKQHAT